MQSEFCSWQHFVRRQEPPKMYMYNVPAQEMAKHPAKFYWPPLSEVSAVTKPRHKTCWNLLGRPKFARTPQIRQKISAVSGPKFTILRGFVEEINCCLTSFFLTVNTCLCCKDIAGQICVMVLRHQFFLGPAFPVSCMQHISDLPSKFTLGPHHV